MKKILLTSVIFLTAFGLFAQSETSKISNNNTSTEGLTYSPQLPMTDSYRVVKNHKSMSLSKDVLLQINKHRKANEDVVWKPEDGVEILIYKRNK